MNHLSKVLLGLMLGGSVMAHAQSRTCGSMGYLQHQINQDPGRRSALEAIENHTNLVLASEAVPTGTITIPVVVHVVYNTSAENISAAQIQSQIDVLNQDFRRTNPDADGTWPQAADSEIEFCLASIDPNGNPTSGITRTSTSLSAFGTNDAVKSSASGGKDAWPSSQYLNMWVCDISGGILGYAQFPGGPASTDGVVIDYQYFGTIGTATAPFDLGRTTTHEVGHWLNLRHIWGDGGCSVDDGVSDTPVSDGPNYGCAPGTVSCGTTDMVQNYMDYSDDGCMNLFTAGQKARMRALFDTSGGARASLLSSGGCGGGSGGPTCSDGIQNGTETGVDCGGSCPPCPVACTDNPVTLSITLDNYPSETSWSLVNDAGVTVASGGGYSGAGSTVTQDLCLPDDCYTFTINDSYGDGICCAYGSGSYTLSGPSGVLASGGSFGSSESTPFCLGGGPAPTCTDGVQNGDETGVDCGGSACPPCATCTDGIQNGDETGVDCGGSVCPPCGGGGGCTDVVLDANDFESTWGIWNDGGSDCAAGTAFSAFANSGSSCVRLRDNTSSSVMTTDVLDLSNVDELTVSFSYITNSMDNANEDFWLQISTNGGSSYTTVEEWNLGDEFLNNVRYNDAVTLTGPFGSNVRLRFRCDASANNDQVYLDDVVIEGCVNPARMAAEAPAQAPALQGIHLFPNPANDRVFVRVDLAEGSEVDLTVTDLAGQVVWAGSRTLEAGTQQLTLETASWTPGMYLLQVTDRRSAQVRRFVVSR